MKKILRILYQPYKFFIYAPLLVVDTAVCGFILLLLSFVVRPKTASIMAIIWARVIGLMTPMRLKVTGRENIDTKQSYVIAANHQSLYDIPVLYGWLGIDFKWVMKQELRKIPIIGICCERLGHIIIDRSNTASAVRSINEAKDKIVNGTSVVFFPEGTRSMDGKLIRFKKGAFKFAIDLGIPILPVTIKGTRDIIPNKTMNLFPGKAEMIIHEPVDVSQYEDGSIKNLMEKVKGVIGEGLR